MIVCEPASRGRRLGAALCDLALGLPTVAAAVSVARLVSDEDAGKALFVLSFPLLAVLLYQSFLMLEAQQTLGMRLLDLYLDPLGTSRVDRVTVALRLWVPVLLAGVLLAWTVLAAGGDAVLSLATSGSPPRPIPHPSVATGLLVAATALAVDLLWLLFPGRRFLHDVAAGTQVLVGAVSFAPVSHVRLFTRAAVYTALAFAGVFAVLLAIVVLGDLVALMGWFGRRGGG